MSRSNQSFAVIQRGGAFGVRSRLWVAFHHPIRWLGFDVARVEVEWALGVRLVFRR